MKPIVIEMKDLSESTEIYEKKPNPAIVGFIYVLVGILVISVIWKAFSEIDIVTECDGVICYTDDVTEVTCGREAKIVKCNVADGQYVTEGTVLFELKETGEDKDNQEDSGDEPAVIRAQANGYFYATFQGEVGAVLQAESRVGYLFQSPQKTFRAQITVAGSDIGKICEGQKVRLEVDAFPVSEYGTITGYVRKIAQEAEWDQQAGLVFPVWIEFDASSLKGRKGDEMPLMSGLYCRAKIVTERKRVLPYVWESVR